MTKIISPGAMLCNFISDKFINIPGTFPTLSQKYTFKNRKEYMILLMYTTEFCNATCMGFSLCHSPTLINLNFSIHSKLKYIPDLSTNNRLACLPISIKWREPVTDYVIVERKTKIQWLKQYKNFFLLLQCRETWVFQEGYVVLLHNVM